MSTQGFKNAPQYTEFKRGMVFADCEGTSYSVVHAKQGGFAVTKNGATFSPTEIPHCSLVLDGIWEGQIRKHGDGIASARVVLLSEDHVAWEERPCFQNQAMRLTFWQPRGCFLSLYPVVVHPEPAPTLESVVDDFCWAEFGRCTSAMKSGLLAHLRNSGCIIETAKGE